MTYKAMDVLQQWPTSQYSIGDFSEIKFRIYQSDDRLHLQRAAADLQELRVLASLDLQNRRVWEFEGFPPGPKHGLPQGLMLLHSGSCKALELLNTLANKSSLYLHLDGQNSNEMAEGEDPQRTKRRPTPMDLYEHFIRANLTHLSYSLARNQQWVPVNLCSFFVGSASPVQVGEATLERWEYRLVSIHLTLAKEGQLFVTMKADHTATFINPFQDDTPESSHAHYSKDGVVIIAPGGRQAKVLRKPSPFLQTTNLLLCGERWRTAVIALLKFKGVLLDSQCWFWEALVLPIRRTSLPFSRAQNIAEPFEVALEWPTELCFCQSVPEIGARGKTGNTPSLASESDECLVDPLEFALDWLEKAAQRQHEIESEQHLKTSDVLQPLSDIDFFGETGGSPIELQLDSITDYQNVYPTPSEVLAAQTTPGPPALDAAPVSVDHSPTGRKSEDVMSVEGEDRQSLGTKEGTSTSIVVDESIGNSYDAQEEPLRSAPAVDVSSSPELSAFQINQVGAPYPAAAINETTSYTSAMSRSPKSMNEPGGWAEGSSPVVHGLPISQQVPTSLPGQPSSPNQDHRDSMGRLSFEPTVEVSDKKYSKDGRFAAPSSKKRLPPRKPTSITRLDEREYDESDDVSDNSSIGSQASQLGKDVAVTSSQANDASDDDHDGEARIGGTTISSNQLYAFAASVLEELVSSSSALSLVSLVNGPQDKIRLHSKDKVDLVQLVTKQIATESLSLRQESFDCQPVPLETLEKILAEEHSLTLPQSLSILSANLSPPFVIEYPNVLVRQGFDELVLNASVLSLWTPQGLEPAHGRKSVAAFCFYPDNGDLRPSCERFLSVMAETWEGLRFGAHNSVSGKDGGIFSMPWYAAASSGKLVEASQLMNEIVEYEMADYIDSGKTLIFYVVTPFGDATALVAAWCALQPFILPYDVEHAPSWPKVVLQEVPLQLLTDPRKDVGFNANRAERLAHEVYDRVSKKRHGRRDALPIPSAASILLAPTSHSRPDFRLIDEAPHTVLMENTPFHLAYCVDRAHEWVTAAWIDSTGMNTHLATYRITKSKSLPHIVDEIWQTTRLILGWIDVHWCLYVTKDTPFQPVEERVWLSRATTHNDKPLLRLCLLTVSANATIAADPKPTKLPVARLDPASPLSTRTNPSTPIPTTPSISSPFVPATPSASSLNNAQPDPSTFETDPNARLIDKTDEAWGLISPHPRNRAFSQAQYRPALASGYLYKRTGDRGDDPLVCMEVDVISVMEAGEKIWQSKHGPEKDKDVVEELLRQVLAMFRGLATLARARGMQGVDGLRPWHVLAARRGVDGVSEGMKGVEFV